MNPTLYDLLGVQRSASAEEIRRAFHERARALEKDAASNPQSAQLLRRFQQAYQILGDPTRRAQYDASLPSAQQPALDIAALWKQVGEAYFQRSQRFSPAIDAVRSAVPIALEGDTLIIGLDHSHATLMGYLAATVTYNEVRHILTELAKRPLEFRVIAGTTMREWQSIKDAEEALHKRHTAPSPSPVEEPVLASVPIAPTPAPKPQDTLDRHSDRWEESMEEMFRQWAALEHRGFPQSRARFVLQQIGVVMELEETARQAGMGEEVTQRHVARMLDRIASLSNIESGVLALTYLRLLNEKLTGGHA
jgi:curved DNA-binding protein CbpA